MKVRTILKFTVVLLIMATGVSSCDKNNKVFNNQAKGEIIEILNGCYGEIVIIEIEEPKGLGCSGMFSRGNSEIKYNNAIGTPYFSKTSIQGNEGITPEIGAWIHFEFREKTDTDSDLFFNPNIICPAIYGTPPLNYYVITKIINYQK